MNEIWKELENHPKYEISNLGNLRKKGETEYLNLCTDKDGYKWKSIERDHIRIHRAVAKAFLIDNGVNPDGTIMEGIHVVNHKNEIKDDNRVENLEWCDNKYNMNYGTWPKRDSENHLGEKNHMYGKTWKNKKNPNLRPIRCIELNKVFCCGREVAEWLGKENAYKQIPYLCKNKNSTGWGYHWEYYKED